jgi:TetR/AcrR family transcriptional repressor of mexJK operon
MTRASRGGSTRAPDRTRSARRGGRPSRAAAERLSERILDAATELFFRQGYGATSVDAVARRTRISKRTFYHRYADKAALFNAVLRRVVDRLRPPTAIRLTEGADVEKILLRLATLLARAGVAPEAVALHRLIIAESARFPHLAAAANRGGTAEAIRLIAEVLERGKRAGTVGHGEPAMLAEQFLYLVLTVPQRRALGFGPPMTPGQLDRWARQSVRLFLDGCRRSAPR